MGSCLLVEVNTWLLVARRYFNRSGDRPFFSIGVPFTRSVRIKVISVAFYTTWIAIRVILYPVLLVVIIDAYREHSARVQSPCNILALAPILHASFIVLNFKWTCDLARSKLRRWRAAATSPQTPAAKAAGPAVSSDSDGQPYARFQNGDHHSKFL